MSKIHLPIAFLLGIVLASTTQAAVPNLIPVQGFLRDADGNPVHNSNATLLFKLYASSSSDTALWQETLLGVNVDEGYFSVYLGTETTIDPLTLIEADELWLEMSVGIEVLGRIRMGGVPFATEASYCEQVGDFTAEKIQRVITGTCGEGSAIRAIGSDGTVTCEDLRPVWKNNSSPAQAIDFVNAYDDKNSSIWPLFCVDIPSGGMLNVEVDISTYRAYASWKAAGVTKYQILFSRNGDGDPNSELVREITAYRHEGYTADLSTESLAFTKNGDTHKFTIDRRDINAGTDVSMRTVVHVRGSGYNISNFVATCN